MPKPLMIFVVVVTTIFANSNIAFANGGKVDVVNLHNGGKIKGNLVEVIPDSLVKIETADGSIFVFNMNEVLKISSEEIPSDNRDKHIRKDIPLKSQIEQEYKKKLSFARWGLFYSWSVTAVGSIAMGDEMFSTTVIPVIGPFATMIRIENDPYSTYLPGGQQLLSLAGILQSTFAVYYLYKVFNPPDIKQLSGVEIKPSSEMIGIRATLYF